MKPEQVIMPPTSNVDKRPLLPSAPVDKVQLPIKRKKIILKKRNPLFGNGVENDESGASHQPIIEENTGASNEESTTNIQQFVLLLKRKLEKDMLKKLISEIKSYKVLGTIDSLIDLLKECHS